MVQPKQKTFQDVINFPNKLEVNLLHIYGTIDSIEPPMTNGQRQRVMDLQGEFKVLNADIDNLEKNVSNFNTLIREEAVPFISPKKKK